MSARSENILLAVLLVLVAAVIAWVYIDSRSDSASASEASYHYKLKGQPTDYPDVMFELNFAEELSPEEKQQIGSAIADKMFENIDDEENHYLHYMDVLNADCADKQLTLYVDFGCNDGTGLYVLLEFLDENFEQLKTVEMS